MSDPTFYPTDRALADELAQIRTSQNFTNQTLGARLGVSATFISKYINDKLDHAPENFDGRARAFLIAQKNRLEDATNLFETSVTKNIGTRIRMAMKTQDVMLVVGPAGEGKSCAARLFTEKNPGTLYLELTSYINTGRKVAGALFNLLERRGDWKGKIGRAEFVVAQLKGSGRPILIDEAHMLDATGRQFLFNLTRDTGCAVVLIGNPEILDKIRRNDQHFSRIGVKSEPTLSPKEIPAIARQIATQFSSEEFADEIEDLVAFVASKPGRLRAVRKTVILAYEFKLANDKLSPRAAFRAAHKSQVRDYHLPED